MENLLNLKKLFEPIQNSLKEKINTEKRTKFKVYLSEFQKEIIQIESDLKLLIMVYIAKEKVEKNFNSNQEVNNILYAIKQSFLNENDNFDNEYLNSLKQKLNSILDEIYFSVLKLKENVSLNQIKILTNEVFSIDNEILNKANQKLKSLENNFNIDLFYVDFIKLKDELLSKYNYNIDNTINKGIEKLNKYLSEYNVIDNQTDFYTNSIQLLKEEINILIKESPLYNFNTEDYNLTIENLKIFFQNLSTVYKNVKFRNEQTTENIIDFIDNNLINLINNINQNNKLKIVAQDLNNIFVNWKLFLKNKDFHPNILIFKKIIDFCLVAINKESKPEDVENNYNAYILFSQKLTCFNQKFLYAKNKELLSTINVLNFYQNNPITDFVKINHDVLKKCSKLIQNIFYLMYEIFDKYFPNYKILSTKYLNEIVLIEFCKKMNNIENYEFDKIYYKNNHQIEINKEKLDEKIYGMDSIKNTLLKNIKIAKYNKNGFKISPTLLVGEPGTGKSYLLKTIAENLNIPYLYFSCNGKEEWTLIGQNGSWKNAKAGEIAEFLDKHNNPKNAIIILDEIDKHSKSNQTNFLVGLSLLLDENLNHQFIDAFNGKEYDLSGITFFMTSNDLNLNGKGFGDNIFPDYLLSRMTLMNVPSYSVNEKIYIIKNIMKNKIISEFDFPENNDFNINDDILKYIINTNEEGGLRQIEKIMKNIYKEYIYLKSTDSFKGFDLNLIKNVLSDMGIKEEINKSKIGFSF